MVQIAKQLAITVMFVTVLYALLVAVSFVIAPLPDASRGLDSPAATESVFMTQPKYVFLNRAPLARDDDRDSVILIGSSNVARGFARASLQSLVPGAIVHNLAVSGSNNTEIAQVVDLIQEMRGMRARERTVFVLGIWYGMFSEDRVRWSSSDRVAGDTDIDIERYRYGFYRRDAGGPVAVLPPRYLNLGVAAVYPFLVADGMVRQARDWARDRLYEQFHFSFLRRPRLGDDQEDDHVVDAAEQKNWLTYRVNFMDTQGGIAEEQFQVLDRMVRNVVESGSRIVIVDLPIPRWHASASPHFADYQTRKLPHVAALRRLPGVTYLNMQDADADLDYYDDAHPKRAATEVWCRRLAGVLNPMIEHGVAAAMPVPPAGASAAR